MTQLSPRLALLCPPLIVSMVLAACVEDPRPSAVAALPSGMEAIPAADAVERVERLEGVSCGDPRPRQDDAAWTCEGTQGDAIFTIQLFAVDSEADLFGAALYVQHPEGGAEETAEASRALAMDLVRATVPDGLREQTQRWVSDHFPDGGRTLDVPDAGITASVQRFSEHQWYVELFELDGRPG